VPNLLVADDNPVSLRFFADALEQLGVDCVLANDGLEAAAKAAHARFDLLLLDAQMPGLDGPEALARIRAQPGPSRDAVALATTADASAATRAALTQAGFAEVIAKPVTLAALRAALARHVPDLRGGSAAEPPGGASLDDRAALAAVGDAKIVAALRQLLVAELDALPTELTHLQARNDIAGLRDRLHRLDASAGFCGAPALARAGASLRTALDAQAAWPHAACEEFLAACAGVRTQLAAH
jgi:CheY-like chemotaxis protein/HPt (histidine-containing phosphotransfer) domain-containing protein